MNMKLINATAVALGTLFTSAAFAQAPANWDRRDARLENRIERGVHSGQITQREAARLQHGQSRIDHMQDRAMRDGRVTAGERARIDHAQDRLGRDIYRQSHDAQTANRGWGPAHNGYGQAHRGHYQDHNQYRHTAYGRPAHVEHHGTGRMDRGNFGAAHGETRGGAGRHANRSEAHSAPPAQTGRSDARGNTGPRSGGSETRSAGANEHRTIRQASNEPRSRR